MKKSHNDISGVGVGDIQILNEEYVRTVEQNGDLGISMMKTRKAPKLVRIHLKTLEKTKIKIERKKPNSTYIGCRK